MQFSEGDRVEPDCDTPGFAGTVQAVYDTGDVDVWWDGDADNATAIRAVPA